MPPIAKSADFFPRPDGRRIHARNLDNFARPWKRRCESTAKLPHLYHQDQVQFSAAAFPRSENSPAKPPAQTVPRTEMPRPSPQPQTARPPQNFPPRPPQQPTRPPLAPSDGFSSLKDIAAKVPYEKKAGTEEHKKDLRAALSDVLKKQPEKKFAAGETGSASLVRSADSAKTTRSTEPVSPAAPKAPHHVPKQEVPEDVLRSLLDESK